MGQSVKKARDAYLSRIQSLGHRDIECQPDGLTLIMPAHSYLGASADGMIRNHKHHNDGPGVLEIKCPFSINKASVTRKAQLIWLKSTAIFA